MAREAGEKAGERMAAAPLSGVKRHAPCVATEATDGEDAAEVDGKEEDVMP